MMTDTDRAEAYRTQLIRLLLAMLADLGLERDGAPLEQISKRMRKIILRLLSPVESAARRLIFWHSVRVTLPEENEEEKKSSSKTKKRKGKTERKSSTPAPVFWLRDKRKPLPELADPRRRVRRGPLPRVIHWDRPYSPPPKPERDPEDGTGLSRRIQAVLAALTHIEAQAVRMAKLVAKCNAAPPGKGKEGPLRPSWPPAYRRNGTREVDDLLRRCYWLVLYGEKPETPPPP